MAESYTFSNIAEILGGDVLNPGADVAIAYLAFDSRTLNNPAQTLFFAIKGPRHDGHEHIKECSLKGVRAFVIAERTAYSPASGDAAFLLVPDTVEALQNLAAWHRSRFHLPVIGITGSNGKTVVKEWLYQLLQDSYNIVRSPKSYNSQIGVPVSVWQIREEHTLGIFEAGISQPGEMANLERIIRPTIGIFTNLSEAHQASFTSYRQKAEEKLELFTHAKKLIYCMDYKVVDAAVREKGLKSVSWTLKGEAGADYSFHQEGKTVTVTSTGSAETFDLPFTDAASVENIMHCYTLMRELGARHHEIIKRLPLLHPVEMRLELKEGIQGCTIINDSYNSDLHSLVIALDTLNQQRQHLHKTLILSDILESGRAEGALYAEVARLVSQRNIQRFIGIGPALSRQSMQFPEGSFFYKGTEDFLRGHDMTTFQNEAILLKGSRIFAFEKIAHRLQRKAHITELHINLSALLHNLNFYRSMLKPETKVMAMVKAFSYGSGSFEIANILQFHKVDYLAVAYVDEGVFLRQHGITLPMLVMNPEESGFENMLAHGLEPEIYSMRLLRSLLAFLSDSGSALALPIHIKLDTGMHRLGFMAEDIQELVSILKNNPALQVKSIFSHLAASDEPEHDFFTEKQIRLFEEGSKRIRDALGYPVLRHILNSSGIVRFPQAQYDMVRLGLGLYGLDPSKEVSGKLEPIASLKTHISQIKTVKAGDTVGYSCGGLVKRESRIATLGIGYADGLPRAYGNGVGDVIVNGRRAPLIGSICMDMCMADVTGMPAAEGDEAIIFGKELPIEEVAQKLGTNAYEVLTNVSQRVKRVYFKE